MYCAFNSVGTKSCKPCMASRGHSINLIDDILNNWLVANYENAPELRPNCARLKRVLKLFSRLCRNIIETKILSKLNGIQVEIFLCALRLRIC